MNPLLYLIRYKKLGLFFIFFYSITFYSYAQDGLFSQYIFNPQLINPALINIEEQERKMYAIQTGDKFNSQFNTYWLSADLTLNYRKTFYNSKYVQPSICLTYYNTTNAYKGINLAYDKKFKIGSDFIFSLATSLNVKHQNLNYNIDNHSGLLLKYKRLNAGFSGVNLFSKLMQSSYFSYLSYKYQFSRTSALKPILFYQFGEKNQLDCNLKYILTLNSGDNIATTFTYKSNNSFMITLDGARGRILSVGYGIEFNKSNMISNQVFLKYIMYKSGCTFSPIDFW